METYVVNFTEGETTGVFGISLVNDPAMEAQFIALSKQEEQIQLKTINEEQRIVCGAVLIPDKLVYRKQGDKEFNIVFPAETIQLASEAFFKNGFQSSSTLEHNQDIKLSGVTVVESWIKLDSEKDKSVMYGMNEPIGTWYASMKIDNPEIWNDYVKTGKVKGFSIDGAFGLEKVNLKSEYNMVQEFKDALKEFFTPLKKEEEVKVELGSIKSADGTVQINFEGDTISLGLPVTMTAPDGTELPVPDGDYPLEDGNTISVMGGLVAEISTAKEEATDPEGEPMPTTPMSANPTVKSEKHTQEVFYQLSKEDFANLALELGKQMDAKINALKVELNKEEETPTSLTKAKPNNKPLSEMTALEKFRYAKEQLKNK